MTVRNRVPGFVLIVLAMGGCGYLESGTWVDEPDNYRRAWGSPAPTDLDVVHSWYWRSSHFTREEAYYFELVGQEGIAEAFVETNRLEVAEPEILSRFLFCFDRPRWFAPGDPSRYRVWVSRQPDALAVRDKTSDRSFIYACQM